MFGIPILVSLGLVCSTLALVFSGSSLYLFRYKKDDRQTSRSYVFAIISMLLVVLSLAFRLSYIAMQLLV